MTVPIGCHAPSAKLVNLMAALSSAKPKSGAAQGLRYNLAVIALAVVLVGLTLAYAIDAASREARVPPHRTDEETTLTRTLGGRQLEVPLSWFRYAEQRVEGFAKQIDLHFRLPLGPEGKLRGIDVTLLPRSSIRPSGRLLDGVYLHMFTTEQREGPPGLVGKPLRAEEGYESETVWYDPLSVDPFVAKCSEPVAQGASRCLRSVHLAPGIGAIYAFDADVLGNWREFDRRMRPFFIRIGAVRP